MSNPVPVLERIPGFSEEFARGISSGIGQGIGQLPSLFKKRMEEKKENQALKRLGLDLAGLSPDLKKEFVKAHITGKAQKQLEKENALQIGIGTIQKMRDLIPSAGPSNYIEGLFGGETTKKRAELEALGRSLIPLVAAGVPIRNQKEFEEYRKVITNPNSRQAALEGALNGLENLFERSLGSKEEIDVPSKSMKKKEMFDLSNPQHKARRDQVLKKTKGDRKKAEQVLSKEFEL